MSLILSDRVKETSFTTGTGSVVLNGAANSFQSFLDGIGDGNTTYYVIENGLNWEVGQGVYSESTNSVSRDIVFDSSNGGSKISLMGVSIVFCTLPADKTVVQEDDGKTYITNLESVSGNFVDLNTHSLTTSGDASFDQQVAIGGDLSLLGDFIYNGDLTPTNIVNSGEIVSSGLLTLVRPDSAGNFLHAYKNDGVNQTIALHVDDADYPLWKLGLKSSPSSETAPPTLAYIFARDGSAGIVSNTENYTSIADSLGFTVHHDAHTVLRTSSLTGVYIETKSSAYPSLVITAPPLASEDLQRWNNASDQTLSVVDSGGKFGILKTDPEYEIDVGGSGRLDTIHLTSGIYFQDGTFQDTAHNLNRVYDNISSNKVMSSADDVVFADATINPINVYIPTAVGNGGKQITIKKIAGDNTVTLYASGSEQIDGQSTYSIYYTYESVSLLSNNLNWFII